MLAIDARAFQPFWRFDGDTLGEAMAATPVARLRVATLPAHGVVGYAIAGRAGRRGYLQRLAVHPDHQGQGLGRLLVLDALHWMRRRAVERAVVNTQLDNHAALALYRSVGFRRQPVGLAVLTRSLRP